jgi:hypothetical protein
MTIERTKLVDKIKALLAKTTQNGCTEQEALAALAKARAMIDAYEISDDELALTREEKAIIHTAYGRDPHSARRFLANACARFAGCEVWIKSGARSDSNLVFCGMRADTDLATWLVDYLAQFVLVELSAYLATSLLSRGDRRREINGFVIGATDRIRERLDSLTHEAQAAHVRANHAAPVQIRGQSRALVLAEIKKDAIKATMAAAGIHIGKGRTSSRVSSAGAHTAGRAAGERATFGRPIGTGSLRLK